MEILSERPITMGEVKWKVKESSKKEEELNARTKKTKEYLNTFVTLSSKDIESLKKKLEDLKVIRLRDRHIVKIIDLLPNDIENLKAVLVGENLTLKQEDMNKIVDVVNEFKNVK